MINSVTPGAPAAASTPASMQGPGGKMGKDEFLKLFVAQIRHQDPLNPMQGDQLAAQLAQFTSVEQLIQMNKQMETQASGNASILDALHTTSAMGMLGRTVMADGDGVAVGAGGAGAVTADIGGAGGAATLRILDKSGREVGSRVLGNVPAGRQTFDLGTAAAGLPEGAYSYTIDVSDGTKEPVPVRTFTRGTIDGIQSGANGPVLTSGPFVIPFGSIVEIATTDPAVAGR